MKKNLLFQTPQNVIDCFHAAVCNNTVYVRSLGKFKDQI